MKSTTSMAWWKDNRPNKHNFPELERKLNWATFYKDDLREIKRREAVTFPITPFQITQMKPITFERLTSYYLYARKENFQPFGNNWKKSSPFSPITSPTLKYIIDTTCSETLRHLWMLSRSCFISSGKLKCWCLRGKAKLWPTEKSI